MIKNNQPQEILRFAQKDIAKTYLGGIDGGEAAINASHHQRYIVIQIEAKNLSFGKSEFK